MPVRSAPTVLVDLAVERLLLPPLRQRPPLQGELSNHVDSS
jgi:hypothetical protein